MTPSLQVRAHRADTPMLGGGGAGGVDPYPAGLNENLAGHLFADGNTRVLDGANDIAVDLIDDRDGCSDDKTQSLEELPGLGFSANAGDDAAFARLEKCEGHSCHLPKFALSNGHKLA